MMWKPKQSKHPTEDWCVEFSFKQTEHSDRADHFLVFEATDEFDAMAYAMSEYGDEIAEILFIGTLRERKELDEWTEQQWQKSELESLFEKS